MGGIKKMGGYFDGGDKKVDDRRHQYPENVFFAGMRDLNQK